MGREVSGKWLAVASFVVDLCGWQSGTGEQCVGGGEKNNVVV